MLPSNPGVLDHLIRERQEKLRAPAGTTNASVNRGVRVRIGHALIAAGFALSGEKVEARPARHSAHPRAV
jgi:hypothetical protein